MDTLRWTRGASRVNSVSMQKQLNSAETRVGSPSAPSVPGLASAALLHDDRQLDLNGLRLQTGISVTRLVAQLAHRDSRPARRIPGNPELRHQREISREYRKRFR